MADRRRHAVVFAVLALSVATYSVFQSVLIPVLPTIGRELDASAGATTWLVTGYLVSASIATPIAGSLGDLFGKRRVLLIVLALCALGTAVAALAESIELLIAGRVVQGLSGAVFPLSFGIVRDALPARWAPSAIAMLSSLFGFGALVAMGVAGPIAEAWGYQLLFWLPLAVVVAAAVGAWLFVPDSPATPPRGVDWLGAALMTLWLVALLVAISQGSAWGWGSGRQLALVACALGAFAAWLAVERTTREPMIDLRLMASGPVWTANVAGLLYGYCLFTWVAILPQFVATPAATGYGFGASATAAGLFFVPCSAAMMLVGPLTGWISSTAGPRSALVLGALSSAIALGSIAFYNDAAWAVYAASALLGAGNGLCYGALPNLIVDSVPARVTGAATGANVVFRNVGGALGSQVATTIVAATVVGAAAPTATGFTFAFALGAGAALLALLIGLRMPTGVAVRAPA